MGSDSEPELTQQEYIIFAVASIIIVSFSGVCSGLTVGLFSLDSSRLQVMMRAGNTEWQRNSARRLLWFVNHGHWTLVTLLVSNASAMSALPLVLDRIVSAEIAIILSISAVLLFGEVVPQALFVRHGFTVCSILVPLLWLLLIVTTVISYPAAVLLDRVIGHQAKVGRDEVEKHLRLAEDRGEDDDEDGDDDGNNNNNNGGNGDSNSNTGGGGGGGFEEGLFPEEIQVMKGALSLGKKTLLDVPGVEPNDAFMISSTRTIDEETIDLIVKEGYGRVPIFMNQDRSHIIGVLLTKSLVPLAYTLNHHRQNNNNSIPSTTRFSDLPLREPYRVQETTKVSDLLASFKSGKSHLACVYDKSGSLVKFVTLDDLFQILLNSGGNTNNKKNNTRSNNNQGDESSSNNNDPPSQTPMRRSSSSAINNSTTNREQLHREALLASTFTAIRASTAPTGGANLSGHF